MSEACRSPHLCKRELERGRVKRRGVAWGVGVAWPARDPFPALRTALRAAERGGWSYGRAPGRAESRSNDLPAERRLLPWIASSGALEGITEPQSAGEPA